jgi:hypothetical protein
MKSGEVWKSLGSNPKSATYYLYWILKAAITKYEELNDLKQINLSHSSGSRVKIQDLIRAVLPLKPVEESFLPCLFLAAGGLL